VKVVVEYEAAAISFGSDLAESTRGAGPAFLVDAIPAPWRPVSGRASTGRRQ
jgi:hypothetical protein